MGRGRFGLVFHARNFARNGSVKGSRGIILKHKALAVTLALFFRPRIKATFAEVPRTCPLQLAGAIYPAFFPNLECRWLEQRLGECLLRPAVRKRAASNLRPAVSHYDCGGQDARNCIW
jgi:hypothetical protein